MEKEVPKSKHCFVCGDHNASGLHLKFFSDGKTTRTKYKAESRHEGYHGILHGGIVATVLDEVMIKAVIASGINSVTASMEVKYRSPVPIDQEIIFEAEVIEDRGKLILTTGKALDTAGKILAESKGKYMRVSPEFEERLLQSLE